MLILKYILEDDSEIELDNFSLETTFEESLSAKEKAARMAGLLQAAAAQKGICLKLRKKPAKEKNVGERN